MVLESELKPHGYAHDYFSKNGYGQKQNYYENGYSENNSSMQLMRPHITTPEPANHYMAGDACYGYNDSSGYGKQQSYHEYDYGKKHNYYEQDRLGHGYTGTGKLHSDGLFGETNKGSYYGQPSHGYPKPSSYGMHQTATSNAEYESHYGSYLQKRPSGYESMSYDYHGDARNRCPPFTEHQHQHHGPIKNLATMGAEWVSKGI